MRIWKINKEDFEELVINKTLRACFSRPPLPQPTADSGESSPAEIGHAAGVWAPPHRGRGQGGRQTSTVYVMWANCHPVASSHCAQRATADHQYHSGVVMGTCCGVSGVKSLLFIFLSSFSDFYDNCQHFFSTAKSDCIGFLHTKHTQIHQMPRQYQCFLLLLLFHSYVLTSQ